MTTITTRKSILFAPLIATLLIPITMPQYAYADDCSSTGFFGEDRCYAVNTYEPTDAPDSVNVDITVDDVNLGFGDGTLQNSLWTILTNERFVEAGFQDQSSDSEKVVCGEGGWIDDFESIDMDDGDNFNAYSLDLGSYIWKTGIDHIDSSTEVACTESMPSGTEWTDFYIGSESTKTSPPDYEHDWDDLEIDYTRVVSSDFNSVTPVEIGTDFDVEACGSGDEEYYHIQTGKGDISSC